MPLASLDFCLILGIIAFSSGTVTKNALIF